MRKSTRCFFFFLLLFNYSYSQPFGGNNAVWHYHWCSFPPAYCSPIIITSTPLDTVNGIVYYTIARNDSLAIDCSFVPLTDTVYESNDTVYYYLASTNRYTMLYNWNALPGDTQKVYVDDLSPVEDSVMFIIDSISTININGFTKKVFHTTQIMLSPFHFIFGYEIIEDIGSTMFLFPQYAFCDPLPVGLRCYQDTLIGLYHPWMPGSSCDTVIYLGEDELSFASGFSLFPNPTNDFINIKYTQPAHQTLTIQLYSLYGQLLSFYKTNGKQEIIFSLKDYPAGIYFVKMNADPEKDGTGRKEEVRKVVKL